MIRGMRVQMAFRLATAVIVVAAGISAYADNSATPPRLPGKVLARSARASRPMASASSLPRRSKHSKTCTHS